MIVLHAGLLNDRFFLWGEKRIGTTAVERPSDRQDFLPQGARFVDLAEALQRGGVAFEATRDLSHHLALWVPTIGRVPLSSSPLIAPGPKSFRNARLVAWKITALRLSPEKALHMLSHCGRKHTLAPGTIIGEDLAFWVEALRFAGALMARQQVFPGLVRVGGAYLADWEPVFMDDDLRRLSRLAGSMPEVCRALTKNTSRRPSASARAVLTDFILIVADYLFRSSNGPSIGWAVRSPRPRQGQTVERSAGLHDRWLQALVAPLPAVQGYPAELAHLQDQIAKWRRPITLASTFPFRLCFRLEEPTRPSDSTVDLPLDRASWRVHYLLQAVDEPNRYFPAEDIWGADKHSAASALPGAKEYLLWSLGQAAGICPHIEDSLKSPAPVGFAVDVHGAYAFLAQWSEALQQAGFVVSVPTWWIRRGTRRRLAVRARVRAAQQRPVGRLALDEVIRFEWEIALGGQAVSWEELRSMAEYKAPLIRVRGQWIQLRPEEIEDALRLEQQRTQETSLSEVIKMDLRASAPSSELPFAGVAASGWVRDLLSQLRGRAKLEILPQPSGFRGTLRPYQVRGFSWLAFLRHWGLGACLADDMGLGKTIQALALVQHAWESGETRPVLLACPMSVVNNWRVEAARFTPDLPLMVHHGADRLKGADFKAEAQRHAFVVTSFGLLHRDFSTLKAVPWSGIILDEAQNIKNPETKQARIAHALQADYRAALTGTPVENNVGDLWSIMEFLNSGLLGSYRSFRRTFFLPIQADRDPDTTDRLRSLVGPFILRRLKTDKSIIAELPEKMEMKVFCTLTKEQAALYQALVRETARSLMRTDGIQRKGLILATLSKLKQICNHPAHFLGDRSTIRGRSGKLARLTEMLEEVLESDERALVFTQFVQMGVILQEHLQDTFGREIFFLHGGVPKKARDRMLERFQSRDNGASIFVLSLKAGGTGLNLMNANHVFHFDRWWNPAVENQATDRAFRIGQTKNVQVHKFLCAGTLEEKIDAMIEAKKEVAQWVVGSGESWLTRLSPDELRELFALRKDMVVG